MTKLNHKKPCSLLNVHAVMPVSCVNGPGARAAVWTQGCSLRCPGCANPQTHSHERRRLVDPVELGEWILTIPGIEGLTVSGGEPFEQAEAAGQLCKTVKEGGLSVMVFTGWTYEKVCQCSDQATKSLLEQIDILIDGPFIQELADKSLLWRGSRNQKIRLLTNRYGPDILEDMPKSQVEGQLTDNAPLQLTGFPEKDDMAILAQELATEADILLTPMCQPIHR